MRQNKWVILKSRGFPGGSVIKNPPANAEDMGSISGSESSTGEGNVFLECITGVYSTLAFLPGGAWPVQSMRREPGRSQTGGRKQHSD